MKPITENQLRIWDNGGETADRYTIILPRWTKDWYNEKLYGRRVWNCLASSAEPFHPQGFGQHGSAVPGPHLGKRIRFQALPEQVQEFARNYLKDFTGGN